MATNVPSAYGGPAPDPLYTTQKQGNQSAYEAGMAQIAADRQSAASNFGYDATTENVADNVDVTNPFSRAALLNRSYAQQQAASTGSYANRGLLTSGAYAAAVGDDARGFAQGSSQLKAEFAQRMMDFRKNETDANLTLGRDNTSALGDLTTRRMQQDAAITDPTPAPALPVAKPSLPKIPNGGPTKVTRSYVSGVLSQAQLRKYGFGVGKRPLGFTAEIKNGKFIRWIAPGGK